MFPLAIFVSAEPLLLCFACVILFARLIFVLNVKTSDYIVLCLSLRDSSGGKIPTIGQPLGTEVLKMK
jgi:hypothetical protein